MRYSKFVDSVYITCRGGRGGEGSAAKKKIDHRFMNYGGDGGKGGDIYIYADSNITDLSSFTGNKVFSASSGGEGAADKKTGKNGEDFFLGVPIGTLVKDNEGKVVIDFDKEKKPFLIARGGQGGKGNFKRESTVPPCSGEEKQLFLDLRLPIDVIVIGAVNSGKSILLSKVTNLEPFISRFPFSTQNPIYGVVSREFHKLVIGELPAVIGTGKQDPPGIKFLKHIYRAKKIVFLVDAAKKEYKRQVSDLEKILKNNSIDYIDKYTLIVINKIDKIDNNISLPFFKMSAEKGAGIEEFIERIFSGGENEKNNCC